MANKAKAAPAAPAASEADGFLRGPALVLAVVTLAFANFMAVLDMTIANVSVPNIAGGLAVSSQEGTWVITSYSVAEAITVPLTGWLAGRFGAVRVFVIAMGAFGFFSMMCGLSPSLGALVLFRVLQGLSGGPLLPMSQTLLQRFSPPHLRGQTMGIWAMTTVVAPIAGPVLGGTISDNMGWSWVFFINVPVAALLVMLASRTLPKNDVTHRLPVDFIGLGLLVLWVGALQIMLDKGKELDWFQSPVIMVLLAVAIVGFIAFIIWELTEEHPIVDLRIFRYRGFTSACFAMCLAFSGMYASLVIIPLWLQLDMGYTATWAGYVTGFNGVLAVVFAPIVATLVTKIDPRRLVTFGILWLAADMFWRSLFVPDMAYNQLIWPQIAQGLAMPFFFIPLMSVAMGTLKPSEIASGAGLLNFVRTTSGAFATSITTTAWDDHATTVRQTLVDRLHGADQLLGGMTQAGLSLAQSTSLLDNIVQSQAVMISTNHIFIVVAALMVVSASAIWFAPKPQMGAPPPSEH
ncbi:MAG TPA: DHA2 family efflux MFS transporter permease subunit [Caulobacteraceae bacterium]|nr:DHA2 family efflux MFS transporter permease subunit [Caulobacteraceae bacterium]